jgi:hypothetical protein
MCHQNPSAIEKPLAPSNELLVAYRCSEWCSRDEMSNWYFLFDAGVGFKIVAKEFYFCTHSSVDIVLIRGMMC